MILFLISDYRVIACKDGFNYDNIGPRLCTTIFGIVGIVTLLVDSHRKFGINMIKKRKVTQ